MRLSECLNSADITTLQKIAAYYTFSCSKHSKMALIQEILYTFRDPAFLAQHAPAWIQQRRTALLRICLEPRDLFSPEELEGILHAGKPCPEAMEQTVREGWLYPTTIRTGRLMYCVPDELKAALREELVAEFARGVTKSAEGPLTFEEEGYALSRDLDVFLEYIRHHDVRLTIDGCMYKRNLQQVLALLEVPEDPPAGGWRFGYGRRFHEYPDRLALLYDYAYHQRFIDERGDGYLVTTDECTRWFHMSQTERQRALLRFYLSSYRRPIPRLPQIVQLMAHMAVDWVNGTSVLQALDPLVNEYYYDAKDQVWRTRILKMLLHLGIIRKGCDERGEEWFQMTQLGQQLITPEALPAHTDEVNDSQRILIVQPNFDIVAAADQPAVTTEVATFAELRQSGVIRVYRMTEETVKRAIVGGKYVEEWLAFLNRHAQTPVPGNVESTLREWERTIGANRGMMTS